MLDYMEVFKKNPLKLQRSCEWLVLRPNDLITANGIDKVEKQRKATEDILATSEYKNSKLHEYYYDMKNNPHSFNDFKRWEVWGRN